MTLGAHLATHVNPDSLLGPSQDDILCWIDRRLAID